MEPSQIVRAGGLQGCPLLVHSVEPGEVAAVHRAEKAPRWVSTGLKGKSVNKHTKGPWKAEGWSGIVVNSQAGHTIVACPCGSPAAELGEIQANAKLIAAAPELLAVAGRLFAYLAEAHEQEMLTNHGDDSSPCSYCEALAEARSVIAKAGGAL